LIVPERKLDFIIAYDSGSDASYSWANGTNLYSQYCSSVRRSIMMIADRGRSDTARSAKEGGIPFPEIPSPTTMQNLNLTNFPTFFGCHYTTGPLVLYLPNAPWSMYSNYSYMQSAFTNNQFDQMVDNSFDLVTYGNGSYAEGAGWPACLACGVIKRSLNRVGMAMPEICTKCFERFCWSGMTDDATPSEASKNKKPILNQGLSYSAWNKTWYT
jgi:lysophospholipase